MSGGQSFGVPNSAVGDVTDSVLVLRRRPCFVTDDLATGVRLLYELAWGVGPCNVATKFYLRHIV